MEIDYIGTHSDEDYGTEKPNKHTFRVYGFGYREVQFSVYSKYSDFDTFQYVLREKGISSKLNSIESVVRMIEKFEEYEDELETNKN